MHIEQKKFSEQHGWQTMREGTAEAGAYQLVLAFGSAGLICKPSIYDTLRAQYPNADILMGSTAGEIIDTQVNDDTISLTAICFERTTFSTAVVNISASGNSYDAGVELAGSLQKEGLKNVMVISDGQMVNGSDLVAGLQSQLPKGTLLTGGLAGDGAMFRRTLVGLNAVPEEGKLVAIGFYGANLSVTYGSVGGWDAFGPQRLITRSEKNVLYEIDGLPALETYKKYLGDYEKELPGSALRFPLSIRVKGEEHAIVRTILGVNEEEQSLTFAGNMPEGAYAQLMMANIDRLIEGASLAASGSINGHVPELAILISCVGRKLVLDQRIEEEIDVVRAAYGPDTAITGFYSYGEISPSCNFMKCELHNQTMTITTMTEIAP